MRRALAAAAVVGAMSFGPAATQTAWAGQEPVHPSRTATVQALDEEPASNDGQDDRAKYGLIGLLGMLGLFGYRKVQDNRAARARTATRTATPPGGTAVGDIDDDGSGSRRI